MQNIGFPHATPAPPTMQEVADKNLVVLKKPEAVVVDLEGTTTSIRFWEECLAPVIWLNTRDCLKVEWEQIETKEVVQMLRKNMLKLQKTLKNIFEMPDKRASVDVWVVQIFKYFKYCVDNQVFTEDIIALQVLVSFYCFRNKICQGHVYEDVKHAFRRWRENNINIGVYSSGISLIQQLLFCYSSFGNLHQFVNEFFSSVVDGDKTNPMAFNRVARQFNAPANAVVFVSDNPRECAAANEAGVFAVLMIRQHNQDLLSKVNKIPFKHIQSFDQLRFVTMS